MDRRIYSEEIRRIRDGTSREVEGKRNHILFYGEREVRRSIMLSLIWSEGKYKHSCMHGRNMAEIRWSERNGRVYYVHIIGMNGMPIGECSNGFLCLVAAKQYAESKLMEVSK